jgi:hypothetical protein
MANKMQSEEIRGEGIHVRDYYVWTEICYLDSPSDYREYLPQDRQWNPKDAPLVMLDSPRQSSRDLCGSLAAVFFLMAGLTACLLLYLVLG